MSNRILTVLLTVALAVGSANSQVLFVDNFNYTTGTTLTSNGWVAHSGAGTNAQTVGATSLTYPGYPSSGVGGAVTLATSGEDVDSALTTAPTTGNVFASVLVRVDSATTLGDYFFHFIANSRTSNTFMARVFAKKGGNGNLTFGISKSSTAVATPPVYADSIYTLGVTYLLVAKYAFNASAADDSVSLFVFASPTLPSSEPTPTVGPFGTTQTDATNLSFIAVRQGGATSAPIATVDGIHVGQTWNDAPLPVQLISFTAQPTPDQRCVTLKWRTISEVNNYGWYVQRSHDGINFTRLPNSFIAGHGTTTEPHDYTYRDCTVTRGRWYYRLEQIDLDGTTNFSASVHVDVDSPTGVDEFAPKVFALQQNYPNPFNPETIIRFTVQATAKTTLRVFNPIGQQVATLFNDVAEAGKFYDVKFNGATLTSGVYFYKLESDNQSAIKKLMLVK